MNTLFENIVKSLYIIKEDAQIEDISDAVVNMHPVSIKYDDAKGGGGKSQRIIYPVAYGISTAGNPVIRAFQKHGSTKTFSPHWKLFRLDRLKSWRVINSRKFNGNELVGFNKEGDEQIQTLYCISPIGNAKNLTLNNNSVPLATGPVTKKDINAESDPEYSTKKEKEEQTKDKKNAQDIVNSIVNKIGQQDKNTIDNTQSKGYNTKNWQNAMMNASDSDPIYQNEIPGGDNKVPGQKDVVTVNGDSEIGNSPISKNDLEKEIDNKPADLINRMDNLNKEEN